MLGRSCARNRPRGYKHRAEEPPSLPDGKAHCRVPPDTPKRLLQGPTARAPYRAQNAPGDREQPAHAPMVATAIAAQCPKTERFCSCRYMNQTRASSSSKNRLQGQAPSGVSSARSGGREALWAKAGWPGLAGSEELLWHVLRFLGCHLLDYVPARRV